MTKDGTFLDGLVEDGLLVTVSEPERGDGPVQFRTRYKLTDRGRDTAEYGEYDRPFTPAQAPVTGTAAELLADREARRPGW